MNTLRTLGGWTMRESGLRFLRRRKTACAVAVTTMALALGANTLVFTITKTFLTASFGLPEPDRLFVIAPVRALPGRGDVVFAEAYANYARLRETQRSFVDVAVLSQGVASWDTGEEARPLQSAYVSASFFATARVQPMLGRAFRSDEEGPGAAPVAILSYRIWNDALAGDPAWIGRTIRIDGSPLTIVGVMPAGFSHPLPTDIWLPFDLASPSAWTSYVGARALSVYGRLRDDVSPAAARAEMDEQTQASIRASEDNRDYRYTLLSFGEYLVPGAARILVFVQLGAALVVLLAIANLSSLLIAWGFDQRQDLAVRLALGGGRLRVVRLLLAESLVVVGMGGLSGVVIAAAAARLLRSLSVSRGMSLYLANLQVDVPVLLVSAAVIAVSGLLAGMLAAFLAGRADPGETLRSMGRAVGLSPAAMRWQQTMVVVQATLSVFIVAVAALIGTSFRNIGRVNVGFQPDGLVVAHVQLGDRYTGQTAAALFGSRLLDNLSAEAELTSYAFTTTLPVGDPAWGGRFFLNEVDAAAGSDPLLLHFRRISAGYTEALGIPLLSGRTFDAHDDSAGTPVAIISRSLAKRISPTEDAVGRTLYRFVRDAAPQRLEIVGVVDDVLDGGLTAPAGEAVYVPWLQVSIGQMSIIAGSRGSVEATLAAVRHALRETDPTIAASNTATLLSLARQATALSRLQAMLLAVFATIAIAMVVLGCYGVITQFVLSREREFALRMVFGARPASVGAKVLFQAVLMMAAGAVAGMVIVALAGSLIEPLLFGVTTRSVPILGGVAGGVLMLAIAAALSPAIRAARTDLLKGLSA